MWAHAVRAHLMLTKIVGRKTLPTWLEDTYFIREYETNAMPPLAYSAIKHTLSLEHRGIIEESGFLPIIFKGQVYQVSTEMLSDFILVDFQGEDATKSLTPAELQELRGLVEDSMDTDTSEAYYEYMTHNIIQFPGKN